MNGKNKRFLEQRFDRQFKARQEKKINCTNCKHVCKPKSNGENYWCVESQHYLPNTLICKEFER